jgi:hypothetical protein
MAYLIARNSTRQEVIKAAEEQWPHPRPLLVEMMLEYLQADTASSATLNTPQATLRPLPTKRRS